MNTLTRLLPRLALAAAVLAVAPHAMSQAFPSRPIAIVVPVAAGCGADALARMIAIPLAERLGQPVVVENRPGAGSNIGNAQVAKARPDGHTLLVMLPPIAYANAFWDNLSYKTTDITPVINMVSYPYVLTAHPAFPPNDLSELVAYAKKNPDKVRVATAGSSVQMTMLLFREKAGISMLEVPYKGTGDARPALLSGTVDLAIEVPAVPPPLVEAGRMKVLGVSGKSRLALYPKAQAMNEVAPDLQIQSWIGLGAPAGTPREIVERLNREVATILKAPEMASKMRNMYYDLELGSPESFAALIRSEGDAYGRIIQKYQLKPN
ncbi:MAG TPA: tripartite tricarboxylate transporter substrate-binding protein [Ramlibacter sp.]|nr:tripartite tricarboxylate transporter substrate-binding protein [Ramlibacter sp.]